MLRKDGKYTIYIIQFKYIEDKDNVWHNAGDCGQFWPARMFIHDREEVRKKVPFDKVNACGDCWQETGVSGTYDFDDALKIMSYIALINPGREFRVSEVKIKQTTTQRCCMKF